MGPAEVGEHPFDHDEIDMVLHEERVVWSTEVVAVERVRLRVHARTETAEVAPDLQTENVELVQDPPSGPATRDGAGPGGAVSPLSDPAPPRMRKSFWPRP